MKPKFTVRFLLWKWLGRTKDVLFVPDPDAKDFLQIRSYYGTMETINPKVAFQFSLFNKAFRVEEIPS